MNQDNHVNTIQSSAGQNTGGGMERHPDGTGPHTDGAEQYTERQLETLKRLHSCDDKVEMILRIFLVVFMILFGVASLPLETSLVNEAAPPLYWLFWTAAPTLRQSLQILGGGFQYCYLLCSALLEWLIGLLDASFAPFSALSAHIFLIVLLLIDIGVCLLLYVAAHAIIRWLMRLICRLLWKPICFLQRPAAEKKTIERPKQDRAVISNQKTSVQRESPDPKKEDGNEPDIDTVIWQPSPESWVPTNDDRTRQTNPSEWHSPRSSAKASGKSENTFSHPESSSGHFEDSRPATIDYNNEEKLKELGFTSGLIPAEPALKFPLLWMKPQPLPSIPPVKFDVSYLRIQYLKEGELSSDEIREWRTGLNGESYIRIDTGSGSSIEFLLRDGDGGKKAYVCTVDQTPFELGRNIPYVIGRESANGGDISRYAVTWFGGDET